MTHHTCPYCKEKCVDADYVQCLNCPGTPRFFFYHKDIPKPPEAHDPFAVDFLSTDYPRYFLTYWYSPKLIEIVSVASDKPDWDSGMEDVIVYNYTVNDHIKSPQEGMDLLNRLVKLKVFI
jgi:hypothetical protein